MTFFARVIRSDAPTGAAPQTQDFTVSGFGTPANRAAFLFMGGADVEGTAEPDAKLCIGFTDGTSSKCLSLGMSDGGENPTVCKKAQRSDKCLHLIESSGGRWGQAAFDSWITDGLRVSWDDTISRNVPVQGILFGGDDIRTKVGQSSVSSSDSGNTAVTGLGFEPDLVIMATAATLDAAISDDARFSLGFAFESGGTMEGRCVAFFSDGGATASNKSVFIDTDNALRVTTALGTFAPLITLASFDSDGFTITKPTSGSCDIIWLALRLAPHRFSVNLVLIPGTPNSAFQVTSPGFMPQSAFQIQTVANGTDTEETGLRGGSIGLGVFDTSVSGTASIQQQNTTFPINVQSFGDDQAINLPRHDQSTGIQATFTSWIATGYELNISASISGSTRPFWSLVFEADSSTDSGGAGTAAGAAIASAFATSATAGAGAASAASTPSAFGVTASACSGTADAAGVGSAFGVTVAAGAGAAEAAGVASAFGLSVGAGAGTAAGESIGSALAFTVAAGEGAGAGAAAASAFGVFSASGEASASAAAIPEEGGTFEAAAAGTASAAGEGGAFGIFAAGAAGAAAGAGIGEAFGVFASGAAGIASGEGVASALGISASAASGAAEASGVAQAEASTVAAGAGAAAGQAEGTAYGIFSSAGTGVAEGAAVPELEEGSFSGAGAGSGSGGALIQAEAFFTAGGIGQAAAAAIVAAVGVFAGAGAGTAEASSLATGWFEFAGGSAGSASAAASAQADGVFLAGAAGVAAGASSPSATGTFSSAGIGTASANASPEQQVLFWERTANQVAVAFAQYIQPMPLPIQFENLSFAEPRGSAVWAELKVQLDETKQIAFGDLNRYRTKGQARLLIHAPLWTGDRDSRIAADYVRAQLEDEKVGDVRFFEIWGQNGRILDDVEWGYDCIARFHVDADFAPQVAPQPFDANTSELLGNTCRKRFKREVADEEGLFTLYDNLPPGSAPSNTLYARLVVKEGIPQRVEPKLIRHPGIILVQLFAPLHTGTSEILRISDRISEAFRAVTENGVVFTAPHVVLDRLEASDVSFQVNVNCPFYLERMPT